MQSSWIQRIFARKQTLTVPPPTAVAASKSMDNRDDYRMLPQLQAAALLGCFLILAYSFHYKLWGASLRAASVGISIAAAALLLGFLAGFIFCIPRAAKQAERHDAAPSAAVSAGATAPPAASAAPPPRSAFDDNSNLVDISDWLTKILVGAGLVELNKIPHALWTLCGFLVPGLGPCSPADCTAQSQAFLLAVLLFFFPTGFLIGYLWTRLYYQKALSELQAKNDTLKEEKTASQLLYDASALSASSDVADWKQALSTIDQALALDPRNGRAYFEKGRILKKMATAATPYNLSQLRDALAYMTNAAHLIPGNSRTYYNIACYQNLLGYDRSNILQTLKTAISLSHDLKDFADVDPDLTSLHLRDDPEFQAM